MREHARSRRRVVEVLKRIAMGLPVAMGPLVLCLSTSGCRECTDFQAGSTSHARTAFTDSLVGPPERFDPGGCNTLCRSLDGLEGVDAGVPADALDRVHIPRYRGEFLATCEYADESTIACSYVERACQTNTGCGTSILGRTPSGLISQRSLASSPLARWLAEGAHLEAASVPAFEDLAAELASFGAPTQLARAARRSADDERRHARQLGRFAHRLGARVDQVRRRETGLRGPEEVAMDNAIEGCGREAYGAIGAAYQAQHAASREVRRVYARIAADEARHALLSFAANDWLRSQLSVPACRRVDEARHESLASLAAGVEQEPDQTLGEVMGLPDATRANELLALIA